LRLFLPNYFYLFLVNQQSALWPSGVKDKKEFLGGAIQRLEGNFYSLGAISHLCLWFALVLASLDNNKTNRASDSGKVGEYTWYSREKLMLSQLG
jgi:hypothetical protein